MHKQKQYESHYGYVDCFKLKQFSLNSTLQLATKKKPDFHSFKTYSWKKLIYSRYNFYFTEILFLCKTHEQYLQVEKIHCHWA